MTRNTRRYARPLSLFRRSRSLDRLAALPLFLALAAALWLPASLPAQVTGAIIHGIVTDPQGAAIPNVQVTVRNTATSQVYTAETNAAGLYEFPALNPGMYTLDANAAGFGKYVRKDIQLALQQRLRVDIAMQLATVQQSVEVSGTPTVVETDSASASHLISSETVANVPTLGRSALWMTRLVAGGNPTWGADGYASFAGTFYPSSISFNGAPAQGNAIFVNGVADQYGNGAMSFVPSTYSVQEVNLQSFALSAEYGQTAGSVISFETKSGTNRPHGTAWYYHNQEAFNANDFFSNKFGRSKAKSRHTQFGANLGGPVVIPRLYNGRNRTFFFGDYEGLRDLFGTQFVNTVPTQLERTGDFSQTRTSAGQLIRIYNPFTTRYDPANPSVLIRDPFTDNKIPASMIEPIATNLLKYTGMPNLPGSFNNQIHRFAFPETDDQFHIRIDHRVSDKHTLYSSFGRLRLRVPYLGALPSGANGYVNRRRDMLWTVGYIWVANPTTIVNVRAGVQFNRQRLTPNTTPADRDSLGLSRSFNAIVASAEFPRIGNSDMASIGYWNQGTSFITPNTRAFVTKVIERHSLTFGYEFRLYRTFNFSKVDQGGYFSFSRDWTQGPLATTASATAGYGVATMLLGTPSSGSISVNANTAAQSVYHALYIQDNWRITQKLTLNAGLRYDYQTPVAERFDRMNRGFDLQAAIPIAQQAEANYAKNPLPELKSFKVRGGLRFVGAGGEGRYNFEPVRNNFMPRAGLAYQLNSKTVVRGGYGLYYMPLVEARTFNVYQATLPLTQLGFSASTAMQTSLGGLPLDQLKDPFPQGIVQPVGSKLGVSTLLGQSISVFDSEAHRARSQQFQFSIQRELPWKTLLDVAYVGSRISDLPVDQDTNAVPPEYLSLRDDLSRQVPNPFAGLIDVGTLSRSTVAKSQLLRPYPQFTGFVLAFRPIGSSWYNSLQVSANKRFGRGVTMLASYTLSKEMEKRRFLNPYDPLAATIAQIDRPHRFIYSGQWEVPVGRGKRYGLNMPRPLQMAVGNWEFSWVGTFHSGQPTGIWSGAVVTSSLQHVDRTVDKWFDTGAFKAQPPFTLNSLSPYIPQIRADGLKKVDFTIAKDFPFTETSKLRVMVQMFNAFNTPQFALPNISVTSPAFGSITSQANQPRWFILAGSLHF